jgi:hypothetical protein
VRRWRGTKTGGKDTSQRHDLVPGEFRVLVGIDLQATNGYFSRVFRGDGRLALTKIPICSG